MSDCLEFDIEKKSPIKETFRVKKIRGLFDYQAKESVEHFRGGGYVT